MRIGDSPAKSSDDEDMELLLVEDAPELATAIEQGLKRYGFSVERCSDGETALVRAVSHAYDAIILDRMLPRLDGVKVCKALRQRRLSVPILMLTARDTVDDRVEGLEAGADDYLTKPFAFTELLARVRALTRRTSIAHSSLLQAGDVSLDAQSGVVTRGARRFQLSAKELLFLKALMRRPGQLVTHAQLVEAVWDLEADPSPEVLRAHVKNLRKKLEGPGDPRFIETVHGMGYRIAP